MAISVSGLTVRTQVGTGTWKDYGGGGGSTSNTDVFLSSTSSRARKISNGIKGFALDLGAGGVDLSNTVVAIRWATLAGIGALDTFANSGVVIRLEDTSGNISDWSIDGGNTYTGGWKVSVVSTTLSETSNSGTAATLTAVRYVGIVWDETASVGGGDPNCYIDEILTWADTGLTITGDSTSLVSDLQAWDDTNDYGIFETRSGITFSKARLILSPGVSDFATTGETLVFEDPAYYDGTNTSSSLNEIGIESSTANVLDFNRLTCVADDNADVNGTSADRIINLASATAVDVDIATFRGFDGATTPLQLGGTGNNYNGANFEACGQATQTGAVLRNCVFRNTTNADGAYEWTTNSDIEDSTFESDGTGHGIDIASAPTDPSTTDFNNLVFTSYGANDTADASVDNNTGHDVLIASLEGSSGITVNTTTNTTVQSSVNVAFNGIVNGSRLYIEATDTVGTVTDGDSLQNTLVSTDPHTYVHNYEGDLTIRYVVAHASGATKYKQFRGTGTISSTGATFNISQISDE
jgi:hypothetical protein